MGSKKFGYARVSTEAQEEARQLDLLMGQYGVAKADLYIDKKTGKTLDREQFQQLQKVLRPGDVVVVESFSRLSRSTKDLLALLEQWRVNQISCVSHKENMDFSTPTGKLMLTFLAAIAEFERSLITERVREGLAAARARGRCGGRPRTDKKKLGSAMKLYRAKTHSLHEIAELTGVSKSVISRAVRAERLASQHKG